MAANRWVTLLAGFVGLASLPACLPMVHKGPLPSMASPEPAGSTEFARLRSPGERVPLHESDATEIPLKPKILVTTQDTAKLPTIPIPTLTEPMSLGPVPNPFEPPLVAAVRAYLENKPDQAIEHLKQFDPQNQELLLQLIPAIVKASQTNLERAGPHDLAVLVSQLELAAAGLSGKVPLMVDKACFVRDVRTFGRYDPLPEGHIFKPGARAELYAEVRNIPSEPVTLPVDGDGFLTKLICTLKVQDSAENVVDLPDKNRNPVPLLVEAKRDFSRSPIRDYFLLFRFPVPAKPGTYVLTFEVRDPATKRTVSQIKTFRVQ